MRDCLPVMQIKIQIQRQLQKYKQIQIYTFIHLQLKGMIWVQWDLHGGFKMKAVGPQRIQKCSQNSISPKKRKCKQVSEVQFVSTYVSTIVSACPEGMAKMHRIGVPLFFWGGEMAANSCAAEIGQARLLGKTGSASKAESVCELCVFLGIQKICAKIHKYKFPRLLGKTG